MSPRRALQRDAHVLEHGEVREHRRDLERAHHAAGARSSAGVMRGDVAAVEDDACPRVGGRNLVSRLKQVVLPAPFGPISAWIVPRSTSRSTPLTATKPANSLVRLRADRMIPSGEVVTSHPCRAFSLAPHKGAPRPRTVWFAVTVTILRGDCQTASPISRVGAVVRAGRGLRPVGYRRIRPTPPPAPAPSAPAARTVPPLRPRGAAPGSRGRRAPAGRRASAASRP